MLNISRKLLYLETQHTLAFLCPTPVLPGHSLVFPKSSVSQLNQLNSETSFDLWLTVQRVTHVLQNDYNGTSTTIEVKDGVNPWLYVNIIPRRSCDLEENDAIYGIIESLDIKEDNPSLRIDVQRLQRSLKTQSVNLK